MKKLLNTLYVVGEDRYLALEQKNVVVYSGEERIGQFPLLMLEGIICFSYKGASPALMGACAESGVQLSFFTPRGRFLARIVGEEKGNVLLRREQYRIADDSRRSCQISRNFVFGKIYNQRWQVERTIRDHEMRVDAEKLKRASKFLASSLPVVETIADIQSLRGIEGEASAQYFSSFNEMILNQKADFLFAGRNRRPPHDNVNAALSFVYSLLALDCAAALESVGLDPFVGFLHTDRPGRKSLALDLMEELRGCTADRFILTQINYKVLQDKHFERREDNSVYLSEEGRKIILKAWQEKKKEEITHPYLKEKICWGLVPYVQGLLLSRYIRGDIDGYPPFLWK